MFCNLGQDFLGPSFGLGSGVIAKHGINAVFVVLFLHPAGGWQVVSPVHSSPTAATRQQTEVGFLSSI